MIAIVDYGMGNLRSVEKAFQAVGHSTILTSDPEVVAKAPRIVLPGVGAFGQAMERLRRTGLADAVVSCIEEGKPFLGICLGMQLLLTESEEMGRFSGLGIVPGRVLGFPHPATGMPEMQGLKVPHMGWNELDVRLPAPPLEGFPKGGMVYFVHSFYAVPEDEGVVTAVSRHGIQFCAAIWQRNIFAVQFHPEKSGRLGLDIIRRFAEWK